MPKLIWMWTKKLMIEQERERTTIEKVKHDHDHHHFIGLSKWSQLQEAHPYEAIMDAI